MLAAGDAGEAHKAAHKIKGSSAALGAANVAAAAAQLEALAREGDLCPASQGFECLEQFQQALERLGAGAPARPDPG